MTPHPAAAQWSEGDYGKVAVHLVDAAQRLVDHADHRVGGLTGKAVVDAGCGTGSVALCAARRGAAPVTGIDVTPSLLAQAAQRAIDEGLDIAWHEADFAAMPLADDTADAVLSNMAMIFAPDPDGAVAEAVRVLRPGGLLALTAWTLEGTDPMRAPLARWLPAALPQPGGAENGPDAWSDPDVVVARLARAGLQAVQVVHHVQQFAFPSVADAVTMLLRDSPMHQVALAAIPPDEHPAVRDAFTAALAAHARPDGSVAFDRPYLQVSGLTQ
jgi:SAM-dependent methyltransferase